jgi:hypothetical protein
MKRVWLPAFVLMSLVTASAQQDMGSVTGTVRDTSGAVLPGVRVIATELATSVLTETTTNAEGLYTLPALKIGHYRVAAELSGFKRAVADSVQISAQSRVRVDLQLELGAMTEEVSVKADAPLLQTETSLLARVLREDEIKELPLNGRNFQQLAVLAAGVLPAFGHRDREGGFNSHGQWATQNNFILDGIDNNSQVLGMEDRKAQVLIPSLDAVQEFQIQTSNYSAEFGRNAGAVMNVSIKSGTNQVKGTAYEFARHDRFDSRDAFTYADRDGDGKADPEELRQHQLGITIGGPIRANRTFFFASVEALRSRATEGSSVTVPTLLERQGIFAPAIVTIRDPTTGQPFPGNTIPRNRWDPVAAGLIGLFPEPNFVGTTRDNYVSSPKHARDRYQYDLRLDHNFTGSDKVFARLSRMDVRDDREGPLPPPAVGAPNNETSLNNNQAHSLALSATRIVGPHVVNEARFGFNALETDKYPLVADAVNEQFGLRVVAPQPVSGLARMTLSGALGYVTLGDATFTPNYKLSRTFQVLDNLTLIRGRHSLKTGVDLRWIQADIVGAPQTRGIFNFNGKFTGSSLGDFLLGMTNTRQFSTFQQGDLRERNFMFYVQDDWKIGPRLTFNLGMRYELSSPMFDTADRMTTLDLSAIPSFRVVRAGEAGDSWSSRGLVDTDPNNWAPRLGFAWQPGSRWSVRGAAGVFYGTTGGGLGASSRLINNWPIFRDVTIRSTPTRSAGQLADGLDPSVLGSTDVMPDNLNWNVWARDFKLPMVEQWNLSLQRQLGSELTGTVSYVGSSSLYLPRSFNMNSADIGPPATERQRRPIPSLGTVTFRETSAEASYHGMEATLDKRLSAGLQFSLAYTWSRSIDDVAELFGAEGGIVQDIRNLPGDRGNSGFDRRHRFSGSSVYESPFGAGRRWLGNGGTLGKILGGWQMSAIISMQSGRYFDVTLPDPTTLLGVTTSNWRVDLVGDPRPANPGPDGWLNPAAFAVPRNPDGSYRFGNLRRNSLLGPGYFNLDGGLMRNFRLGAGRRLQLRWEVFNATNHPSYGLPTTNLLSRDFGTIRGTVGNPRQMQFGLKFIY